MDPYRRRSKKMHNCNRKDSDEATRDCVDRPERDRREGWFNPDGTEITVPEFDESAIPEVDPTL